MWDRTDGGIAPCKRAHFFAENRRDHKNAGSLQRPEDMERWLDGLRKAGLPEYPPGHANVRIWLQADIIGVGSNVRYWG